MDLRRLRAGEWIAALGGTALLVSLFFTWYSRDEALSAWQAFAITDMLLALVALSALSVVPVTAAQRMPAVPLALDAFVALAGKVAVLLVLIRMVSPPGDAEGLGAGIWLALAGSAAIVAAGWIAMRDERLSGPGRVTDLTGRPHPESPPIETIPAP
jgi:hypothetical protein